MSIHLSDNTLYDYFNFNVCRSICLWFNLCVRKLTPIPAVFSQNSTNKSCLLCVKSEKMHSWSPSDPWQWLRYWWFQWFLGTFQLFLRLLRNYQFYLEIGEPKKIGNPSTKIPTEATV